MYTEDENDIILKPEVFRKILYAYAQSNKIIAHQCYCVYAIIIHHKKKKSNTN